MQILKCPQHDEPIQYICNSTVCQQICVVCSKSECKNKHIHNNLITLVPINSLMDQFKQVDQRDQININGYIKQINKYYEEIKDQINKILIKLDQQLIKDVRKFEKKLKDFDFTYQKIKNQLKFYSGKQIIKMINPNYLEGMINKKINYLQTQKNNFIKEKSQIKNLLNNLYNCLQQSQIITSDISIVHDIDAFLDNLQYKIDLSANYKIKNNDFGFLSCVNTNKFQCLKLRENNISRIDFVLNFDFRQLEQLDLFNNKIKDLNPLIQSTFPKIKIISFQRNYIQDLTPLISCDFKNLKVLNLSCNKIKDINPLISMNFNNLNHLFLSNNMIESIEALRRIKFKNLKQLYIQQNERRLNRTIDQQVINNIKQRFGNKLSLII